jgi:ubiquitin-conjugating enzyme E2 Z
MSNIRLMKELKILKESSEMYIDILDENIKKFKIMFFGPKDSLFQNGIFLFEFLIPDNYPFDVPKVTFLTGGFVNGRIHPNLYKEGKVCLSILNTWGNNEWSPLLTIEKVILTIKGILDNNPISHEPRFENKNDAYYNIYSTYYSLKSIPMVYNHYKDTPFGEIIKKNVSENYENIKLKLDEITIHHNKSYNTIHHNQIMNIDALKSGIINIIVIKD